MSKLQSQTNRSKFNTSCWICQLAATLTHINLLCFQGQIIHNYLFQSLNSWSLGRISPTWRLFNTLLRRKTLLFPAKITGIFSPTCLHRRLGLAGWIRLWVGGIVVERWWPPGGGAPVKRSWGGRGLHRRVSSVSGGLISGRLLAGFRLCPWLLN